MSFRGSITVEKSEDRPMSPPLVPPRIFTLPSGKEITSDGLPASIEKEKLEKYLLGLFPSSSSSPAQRFVFVARNFDYFFIAVRLILLENIYVCVSILGFYCIISCD